MRYIYLCFCPILAAIAQQKDISFQKVNSGVFYGYTEDAKAEKAWEASALSMLPSSLDGQWEMKEIKLLSLRMGKSKVMFTSPNAIMTPAQRAAKSSSIVRVTSKVFTLTGLGWSWHSATIGDSFSIFSQVNADITLSNPVSRKMRLNAERMDAAQVVGGTRMIFEGKVNLERSGERINCDRVEFVLNENSDGSSSCRSLAAYGNVKRIFGLQSIQGEIATFNSIDDSIDIIGQVEFHEPESRGTAHRLHHDTRTGMTELFSDIDGFVKFQIRTSETEVSDLQGKKIRFKRDIETGISTADVVEEAVFKSEHAKLTADRVIATTDGKEIGKIVAEGTVSGQLEKSHFTSGVAHWNWVGRIIDLYDKPRLREGHGLEIAGYKIMSDLLKDRLEIRSGPGVRAAILIPAERINKKPGLAEADQIVVVSNKPVMQVELSGSVSYSTVELKTSSDKMVAFATLQQKNPLLYMLKKAILIGDVNFFQSGLRCKAERIDYTPDVKIEEFIHKDALVGRPLLLTLSGRSGQNRPKIYLTEVPGKEVELIADAHEVLYTPHKTKFFLRGTVSLRTDDLDAKCDLLEGMASPDNSKRLTARHIVGRGNVSVMAGGITARGRTLEMNSDAQIARLFGEASVIDKAGNEVVPAKEVSYDFKAKSWLMDSERDSLNPGQVVRPKIFLGEDFTMPEIKSLDKER